jgi:large subunit ribosomal protein L3
VDDPSGFEPGQLIDVSIFKDAAKVDVSGKTKGKGFQGVIKRHGFHGGRKTHGSHSHRVPGSVGMSAYPGRVIKGKKMPGRTGHIQKHVKNLEVVEVDTENNLLLVKGAVPGARNTILRLTMPK